MPVGIAEMALFGKNSRISVDPANRRLKTQKHCAAMACIFGEGCGSRQKTDDLG
jgi:hypothetical protein